MSVHIPCPLPQILDIMQPKTEESKIKGILQLQESIPHIANSSTKDDKGANALQEKEQKYKSITISTYTLDHNSTMM